MTNEQLAEFLDRFAMGDIDYSVTFCDVCGGQLFDCFNDCLTGWLKQEAKEIMGTNYYAVKNRPSICDGLHIGKANGGWRFLFNRINDSWCEPEVHWNSYEEVCAWLKRHVVEDKDYVILNEYDEIVSYDEFIKIVENHQSYPENFEYCDNVNGYRFTSEEFW